MRICVRYASSYRGIRREDNRNGYLALSYQPFHRSALPINVTSHFRQRYRRDLTK
jgi:hypothetical protein